MTMLRFIKLCVGLLVFVGIARTQAVEGCSTCHTQVDAATMHTSEGVHLSCTDCHGGDPRVVPPRGLHRGQSNYDRAMAEAHPHPKTPQLWKSSANPARAYADWLKESEEYVRFVNPGDLRAAPRTCGRSGCHVEEVRAVVSSMMTHGGMLWGAALYNNGAFPLKDAHFGESYSPAGEPRTLHTWPPPDSELTRFKGILPALDPLPLWETSQPGNLLRVFERGGGSRVETGNPERDKDPGKPDDKLSNRGLGTLLRTDPVFLGLQKTRLMDPLLSMPGTNDHPGDYRASGCSACHVIYANDRDPSHSGAYAIHGNQGRSAQSDPTIPKNESGHPIRHQFTRSIPSSQCIVCHIHPGTNMVASYLGYTWWDNESDGEKMYPAKQHNPSDEERFRTWQANPEGAAARGRWSDADFLEQTGTPQFNAQLKQMQFGDFHGHGWVFRAVYKRDRAGNLLDSQDRQVKPADPDRFRKAVHLQDIHLEKGMHCSDCHFAQDSHGNGHLYGETRNAVEIDCIDCHGTIRAKATLRTSAAAAPRGGSDMEVLRTPWGQRRFVWRDGKLYQRSMLDRDREWEVVQVMDTITPGNPHYNEKSAVAKTLLRDGKTWGGAARETELAHANSNMTCYACHSSWTTSCFGCHLPMTANGKSKMLHNEGLTTRNYTSYNFETLRDDIYMLGVDGTVTGHRIAPTRSTCAVVVSSQNANRDWLYYQQQTISSAGFSGFAFSTYYPHTVRARETKTCTDCHVSAAGDNNAWMAQLLMQGTNLMNTMGRYVYVAEGARGFEAVAVAEHDDPPAVYGSDLHKIAYPDDFRKFGERGFTLNEAVHHDGNVVDLQMRGEYLYAAAGRDGFRIFDIANIDNKNFSQKVSSAPVSPLGQRFYVRAPHVTSVASPSTLAIDPLRSRPAVNEERPVALMYGFLYATDLEEGLLVIGNPDLKSKAPGVLTLLDGNPSNNFLTKAVSFNPHGALNGARRVTIAGHYAYVLATRGLVVVDIENPLDPKITGEISAPALVDPRAVAIQFRYAFVADAQGVKTLDVTDLARPRVVPNATVELADARNIYVARTYAYVAGGRQGLVILDVRKPEHPVIEQAYTAGGKINDTHDVKLGITNASAFAYLADGANGLRVVQIFAPNDNPNYLGFSPRPTPKLIATYRTRRPAMAISKGIDRDRAVDESGNQLSVFNRRGSGPLTTEQARSLYIHPRTGEFYTVTDTPPRRPEPAPTYSESRRNDF
jgi:hypothetical protein